jgi:hypothetical protein
MSTAPISKVWTFGSSSSDKTYETLQYIDGTTSCGCPGWTRRVAADGTRSCKHPRLVDQGMADRECESSHDYHQVTVTVTLKVPHKSAPSPLSPGCRKMIID